MSANAVSNLDGFGAPLNVSHNVPSLPSVPGKPQRGAFSLHPAVMLAESPEMTDIEQVVKRFAPEMVKIGTDLPPGSLMTYCSGPPRLPGIP
jgi:hypothetical protein